VKKALTLHTGAEHLKRFQRRLLWGICLEVPESDCRFHLLLVILIVSTYVDLPTCPHRATSHSGSAIFKIDLPKLWPFNIPKKPSIALSIPSVTWSTDFSDPSRIYFVTFSSLSFLCCIIFGSKTRKPCHLTRLRITMGVFLTPYPSPGLLLYCEIAPHATSHWDEHSSQPRASSIKLTDSTMQLHS